jgi:flagellin FlaB
MGRRWGHYRAYDRDEAFSGIEAAILLIVGVVVASVLSFAVLSMTYDTSETAGGATAETVGSAGSVLLLFGDVHGMARDGGVGAVRFTVMPSEGSGAIDFSRAAIVLASPDALFTPSPDDPLVRDGPAAENGTWAVVRTVPASAADDAVLEAGERFTLSVSLPDGEVFAPGEEFTLTLSAPGAVTFDLRRQVPAKVDAVTVL